MSLRPGIAGPLGWVHMSLTLFVWFSLSLGSVFDPIQNEPDPCDSTPTGPLDDDPQQTDAEYPPALPVGINLPALPYRNYLTIVNGSPYKFKLTSDHEYQMDKWVWHDIPAGESRQNMFEYRAAGYAVDDKGEAYYEIEGTGKTFAILIRTDYANPGPNSLAKIDYRGLSTKDADKGTVLPIYTSGGGHGIEWVLTGSEDYGYWSSYNPPEDWMHSVLGVIGDRKLKHVCMPGSHDAGIYQVGSVASVASARNCQTQTLTFLDQMRRGSRYFDIRPVIGDGGKYLTGHYTKVLKTWYGCNGGSMDDLVSDTNKFLAANDELVIFRLSDTKDTDNGYDEFTSEQWEGVLDIVQKIERKCANFDADDLTEITLNEYIGTGGCALIIIAGGKDRPSQGIYHSGRFPTKDDVSDSDDQKYMANDQIAKLQRSRNIRGPASVSNADTFFVLSWTLTSNLFDDIVQTIHGNTRLAHDTLYWKAFSAFTPFSYPNVLLVDYYGGVSATDYASSNRNLAAMAMAVNLQIASQNCHVGGGKIVNSA